MSQVEQLEQHLSDQKKLVDVRQMALRLAQNRDFKKLILEGFCKEECARHVLASVNVGLSEEARAHSLALAQAAGHLKHWLTVQVQMGEHAERTLTATEHELAAARQEEDDGELVGVEQ